MRRPVLAAGFGILLAAVLWPARGYVPLWDGRVYANCAIDAAQVGLSLETLRCAGHHSQGFLLWPALGQLLAPGSVDALLAMHWALGLVALLAFHELLGALFPGEEHRRARILLTLVLAVDPAIASTLVQPNIDTGVYVFGLVTAAALARERHDAAILAGLLCCFSKETGVAVYGILAGLHGAWVLRRTPRAGRLSAVRALLPLTVPLVLYAAYLLLWQATRGGNALWRGERQDSPLDGFHWLGFDDPILDAYGAAILIVGFRWILTLVLAAGGIAWAVRRARGLEGTPRGGDGARLGWIVVATLALLYLLTAYRTWVNLRYFALLYPLLLAGAYAALTLLVSRRRAREAALLALAVLFASQLNRSSDPVSRRLYGSFDAGGSTMYRMSAITQDYPGPGRDQLVYNLQFTGLSFAQDALYRRLGVTDATVLATARRVRWHVWSQLEPGTLHRTLRRTDVVVPRFVDERELAVMPDRPPVVHWLQFRNGPDGDPDQRRLARWYRRTGTDSATARGHRILAHRYELRP